jgi:carbon starvation protein
MNKWVLFGHHFAAIAGAGPLLGPVLAAQFGYLPGFLWLVIGAVLAGAVQDFIILVSSIRRDGRSFPQIARDEIGPVTGLAAAIAVLFIVIVALAGLGLAVVNALYRNPWGTFTLAMTIPIAFFMGFYLQRIRPGRVGEVSVIGIGLLILTVILGRSLPGSWLEPFFDLDKQALVYGLAAYGFLASVLPVWMLLAPRDYLSTFMKIGVVAMLGLGVIAIRPVIHMPAVTPFINGSGLVIPGKLFPFLFITIACGAISGFHCLVSSGTTPKMIEKEGHAMMGYGAMLIESFVGVISLIAASILVPGDYFAINTHLSVDALAAAGFPVSRIQELSHLVEVSVAGRPGGAVSLAVGMASIFSALPGMKHLMAYWYQFALLFEALFILTTIDAGTRVARFILQDLGGNFYPRLKDLCWMPGTAATSLLVVFGWGYFIATGSIATVWPMFGAANQLLGMLALCIGTTILLKMGKARYLWVTLIPMVFVGVITLTACYELFFRYLDQARAAATAPEAFPFKLNAGLVGTVATIATVILIDSAIKWYGYLVLKKPMTNTEVSMFPQGPAATTKEGNIDVGL